MFKLIISKLYKPQDNKLFKKNNFLSNKTSKNNICIYLAFYLNEKKTNCDIRIFDFFWDKFISRKKGYYYSCAIFNDIC